MADQRPDHRNSTSYQVIYERVTGENQSLQSHFVTSSQYTRGDGRVYAEQINLFLGRWKPVQVPIISSNDQTNSNNNRT